MKLELQLNKAYKYRNGKKCFITRITDDGYFVAIGEEISNPSMCARTEHYKDGFVFGVCSEYCIVSEWKEPESKAVIVEMVMNTITNETNCYLKAEGWAEHMHVIATASVTLTEGVFAK